MRTVTLTGTMNLHSLLQTGSSEQLAMLIKQGLQDYGWNAQSVSISGNSIFNNQLNVEIVIIAAVETKERSKIIVKALN